MCDVAPEVERLAKVIDIIARKCWRGLPSLLGKVPQPTRDQLKAAFLHHPSRGEGLGVRVHGGESNEGREIVEADKYMDEFECVLDLVTWSELVDSTRWYAKSYPQDWSIYVEYLRRKEMQRSRWGGPGLVEQLALDKGISPDAVADISRRVPTNIARDVSIGGRQALLFAE